MPGRIISSTVVSGSVQLIIASNLTRRGKLPANRNKNIYTIRTNVRAAIEVFENISQAADQLNINRQQLTKYISGTMSPSIQTLSRIGSYFNCEIDDFLLNKNDFIYKINFKNTLSDNFPIAKNSFNQLVDQASLSSSKLKKYCGTYFLISTFPTIPNYLGRAVMRIYQINGITYSTVVEVFWGEGGANKSPIFRKLHAIVIIRYDRIYFFDASQETRFSNIILYAESLPTLSFLSGYIMTVSDRGSRRIFCGPLILQRLPGNRITKKYIGLCGMFHRDSPDIEEEVRSRLSGFD